MGCVACPCSIASCGSHGEPINLITFLFRASLVIFTQIPVAIEQRGVFYKQSMAGFFPTSAEVVADTLVNTGVTVRARMSPLSRKTVHAHKRPW